MIEQILEDIKSERQKQDVKWGIQDHPDDDPSGWWHGKERTDEIAQRRCEDVEIPIASRAKFICDTQASRGQPHWSSILVEEVSESVDAIGNDERLREELIQVAAVAVAWIEAIDRRQKK